MAKHTSQEAYFQRLKNLAQVDKVSIKESKNRTLGTFTFKKPFLLELNKIATALTTEIEQGNDDLNLVVAQLWDSCTKIPFESDKNISLPLLQEPQLPIRNFTIVEVESAGNPQSQSSGSVDEIMPPLTNIRYGNNLRTNTPLNKSNIIIYYLLNFLKGNGD
jgi:hypothetical protein